jgi:superfamily I DNA/RNA helicase
VKATAILGPPGTGKTTTLQRVIADLPKGRMAVVSFTRAAAGVLTSRLPHPHPKYVGTLHALAYKILGLVKQQVVDEQKFASWYGTDLEEVRLCLQLHSLTLHGHSLVKAYRIINPVIPFLRVEHLIGSYLNWKSTYGYIDFNDMITLAMGKAASSFDVIICDEAQDMSDLQWQLVLDLLAKDGTLIMAGDDDQAIFTWSGANPHGMRELAHDFEVLSQSHRLPRIIHGIAEATVSQIKDRIPKEYLPKPMDGQHCINSFFEPMLFNGNYTVLCRDKWVLAEVEDALIERGVPYVCTSNNGKQLFSRGRARLIRAILEEDRKKIERYARYLKPQYRETDVIDKPWQQVVDLGTYEQEAQYLSIVDHSSDPQVTLSTIHGFKGEEDDHVVVMCQCSGITESAADAIITFENEVRVWYVALTRAKQQLTTIGWNSYVRFN